MAYKVSDDLREAEAMVNGLESYIRSDELYGSAGSGGFFSNMPKLTLGSLLMRLRRLEAMRDDLRGGQQKTLDSIIEKFDYITNEWSHHAQEKMLREAHSRLDAMQTFFKECGDDPARCQSIYRPELSRRTIVQELMGELERRNVQDAELEQKLRGVDGKLRGFLAEDGFQWDESLESHYPRGEYWWLYQKPPAPADN